MHVEGGAGRHALPDLLGRDAARGNDDRLARTLDALVPPLDELWQELIVGALQTVVLDLSVLGYDITSLSFCGDDEDADRITFGDSRDHRPDRRQLELATTVTIAGGGPRDDRVLAGNTADRTTPVENLRRLPGRLALLSPRHRDDPPPLVVSDRAMRTADALRADADAWLGFLGPLDPIVGHGAVRRLRASVSTAERTTVPLFYRPQRAAEDPTGEGDHGVLRPREMPAAGGGPPLRIRALVVGSPATARRDARLRPSHLERLEPALADLAGKLGRRPDTPGRRSTSAWPPCCATSQPGRPGTGGPEGVPRAVTWARREEAVAQAAALEGRDVLGTTTTHDDPSQMLARSPRRDVSAQRYASINGPLAVRPVDLHKEDRIRALEFCTIVALLVFALRELLARRAAVAQSGTALLAQFPPVSVLGLLFQDGNTLRHVTGLAPPLATLLQTLGFPPADRDVTVHG